MTGSPAHDAPPSVPGHVPAFAEEEDAGAPAPEDPASPPRPSRAPLAKWLDLGFVALGVGAFALLAWKALVGETAPTELALASEAATSALGGPVVLVSARPEPFLVRADGTRLDEGDRPSDDTVLRSVTVSEIVLERDGRTVTIVVD